MAWQERLRDVADRLFAAGWPDEVDAEPTLGSAFSAQWMRRDWTLRERLAALAAFRPIFEREGFRFKEGLPTAEPGVYLGVSYTAEALRFIEMAYDYGWVRTLQWTEWRKTDRGKQLMANLDATASAHDDDLAHVLTTCMRADRFSDGYLGEAFEAGLISRVAARAETLLRELPSDFGR